VAGGAVDWLLEGVYLPAFPDLAASRAQGRLYGSDVAFVGSVLHPPVRDRRLAGHRRRLLDRLSRRYRVTVWGPQRRPGSARALGVPRCRVVRWPAYHDELVKICRASAVVLGINTVNSVELYFSNRTFLTLASGGFHLTHYVPGLERLFENHRHLVWYRSDDECLDLCRHYLARPAARRRIAAAGRRLVRRRFGMARQLSRLLRLVARHAPPRRTRRRSAGR
jgi:spore maturation protein CgeB